MVTAVKKPQAPEGMYCPLWRKDMSKVCHTCGWWEHLRGKNPQTGADMDDWRCSISWFPILMVENSNIQRITAASVQSARNEAVMSHCESVATMLTGDPANAKGLIERRLASGHAAELQQKLLKETGNG